MKLGDAVESLCTVAYVAILAYASVLARKRGYEIGVVAVWLVHCAYWGEK